MGNQLGCQIFSLPTRLDSALILRKLLLNSLIFTYKLGLANCQKQNDFFFLKDVKRAPFSHASISLSTVQVHPRQRISAFGLVFYHCL